MASQITGYIGQINPGNGINYSIGSTVYGECNTAAATAAKTVDMTGFTLIKGATIYVKFINANTASSPTLNIQGTGAKPIIQNNFTTMYWPANTLIGLTYDGTNWVTNDLIDYNNFLQIKPKGGYYNNNKISENSIDVGAIKITLPVPANSNNNAMLNFQVVIYHYNSKDYVTYYISGYPFENTWHPDRCNAYSISNVINSRTNATVRYGNDGTNLCITIGEENTSWKWSQIYITNVYVGYTNITQEKYKNYMDGDWNISFSSIDPVLSTIDYTIENPNILTSITNAINNLDVSNISGFGKGRTLSALSETNGKISATFQDIEITTSQVSDFPSSMPASDVSAWAKAANKPSYSLSEITSASDIQAIEVLTGTSGFLKKTAENKWELDTTTYVTSSGVTSITLKAGTGISLDTDNTAITTSGTRTISLANNYGDTKNPYGTKNKNLVLASSSNTNDVAPSFRALVAADLPTMYWANVSISNSSATNTTPTFSSITLNTTSLSKGENLLTLSANNTTYYTFRENSFGPTSDQVSSNINLGTSTYKWNNLYLKDSIYLYNEDDTTKYVRIKNINNTTSVKVNIPNYNGNMFLTHTGGTATVGSEIQPVYVAANGRLTKINYTIETNIPSNALFTDEKVKQTSNSSNANYKMLFTTVASPTSGNTYETYYNSNLIYNPSTNKLSTGNLDLLGTLNVTGATTLSDNVTVDGSLTANELMINGASQFNNSLIVSGVSQFNSGVNNGLTVNNGYLILKPYSSSYNIENSTTAAAKIYYIAKNSNYEDTIFTYSKLRVSTLLATTANFTYLPTIGTGNNEKSLLEALGLSNALHFIGKATNVITDGGNENPGIDGYSTKSPGDIIIDKDNIYEYVYTKTNKWEKLGPDGDYKQIQSNSVSYSASTTNSWISGIQQNINGDITSATYSTLDTSGNWTGSAAHLANYNHYSNSATQTINLDNDEVAIGAMFHFTVKGSVTGSPGVDSTILQMNWTNSTGYNSQFGIQTNNNRAFFRRQSAGTWQNWQEIAHGPLNTQVGSSTKPVYLSNTGTITEGTQYAGGTNVTLNGTPKSGNTIEIYTPTTAGISGQILISSGNGAPQWSNTTNLNDYKYWANIESTSAATYNTEPEVKSIKVTGNSSANTSATNGVVLQYDATLKVLNFVFA